MPHAMTDVFTVDDTITDARCVRSAAFLPMQPPSRQQEAEVPGASGSGERGSCNERAMRAATAAWKNSDPRKRQQGGSAGGVSPCCLFAAVSGAARATCA